MSYLDISRFWERIRQTNDRIYFSTKVRHHFDFNKQPYFLWLIWRIVVFWFFLYFSKYDYSIITEGKESKYFWNLIGQKQKYPLDFHIEVNWVHIILVEYHILTVHVPSEQDGSALIYIIVVYFRPWIVDFPD